MAKQRNWRRFEALEPRCMLSGVEALATAAGAVNIPQSLVGSPGGSVVAPINIDEGSGIRSAELVVKYDEIYLSIGDTYTYQQIDTGKIAPGTVWPTGSGAATIATFTHTASDPDFSGDPTATISITVFGNTALPAGAGSLVTIQFAISPTASVGQTITIDFQQAQLSSVVENDTPVSPPPIAGADSTDGEITIDDVTPTTPVDTDPTTNAVDEGAGTGVLVGITANSTSSGGAVAYSLTTNPSDLFAIDHSTGVVSVAAGKTIPSVTTASSYTIGVTAIENDIPSPESSFAINVNDVLPTTPVDTDVTANVVSEGAGAGTLVGITASSTDPGGAVAYSLSTNPSGLFTINSGTGVVSVAAGMTIPSAATAASYTIGVTATENGASSSEGSFTITVGQIGRVSGFVYADTNRNYKADANEGVPGVKINLTNTSTGAKQDAWTDDNGWYEFRNLSAGAYQIAERQPAALLDGGSNIISGITLGASQNIASQNFRELGLRPEYIYNRLLATTTQPVGSSQWCAVIRQIIAVAERKAGTPDPTPPVVTQQVVQDGSVVTVRGTNGNDSFQFNAATTTVILNGESHTFDPASVNTITFDGGLGKDTAEITGSTAKQQIDLSPMTGTIQTASYTVNVYGTEKTSITGGSGGDEVVLHDSAADDSLNVQGNLARLAAYFYSVELSNMQRVHATSSRRRPGHSNASGPARLCVRDGRRLAQSVTRSSRSVAQPVRARLFRSGDGCTDYAASGSLRSPQNRLLPYH